MFHLTKDNLFWYHLVKSNIHFSWFNQILFDSNKDLGLFIKMIWLDQVHFFGCKKVNINFHQAQNRFFWFDHREMQSERWSLSPISMTIFVSSYLVATDSHYTLWSVHLALTSLNGHWTCVRHTFPVTFLANEVHINGKSTSDIIALWWCAVFFFILSFCTILNPHS